MASHHSPAAFRTTPKTYHAVPQSPDYKQQQHYPQHPPPPPSKSSHYSHDPRDDQIAHGVASGHIGSGFGPYSYPQGTGPHSAENTRFSSGGSETSYHEKAPPAAGPQQQTNTISANLLWDSPDLDDALHAPDPKQSAIQDAEWTIWSARGWANYSVLFVLLTGLIILFCGYPIITYYRHARWNRNGFNLGGINATGQIPDLKLPRTIDADTPESAYTRTGWDGEKYNLVFSDEFEVEGRSFYPGDDPFWEAVDLHYWPTLDLQWYDPGQVTTQGGSLVITMAQERNHNMNFMSGMIQSWNKFCFTGGYIEVSVSLPGTADIPGFWPGAWTMGNLGRAGYGASTEGMWPYSYDECDVGTFPNQTTRENTPADALEGSSQGEGRSISFLPGQRLSSCTCPGSDHPGPQRGKGFVGRAAPEIDILEAQIAVPVRRGQVSQSVQIAPFDYRYEFPDTEPNIKIYDPANTVLNTYKGAVYQEALSALTYLNPDSYVGSEGGFSTYGFEYHPSRKDDGFITWTVDGQATWTIHNLALAPNPRTLVGQRLIPEEPMYIVLNFGMSPGFQAQDFQHLVFPNRMLVDYVRVYQRDGHQDIGCDPAHHPTSQYIIDHIAAYSNVNLTVWSEANFTFPRNSEYDGC